MKKIIAGIFIFSLVAVPVFADELSELKVNLLLEEEIMKRAEMEYSRAANIKMVIEAKIKQIEADQKAKAIKQKDVPVLPEPEEVK